MNQIRKERDGENYQPVTVWKKDGYCGSSKECDGEQFYEEKIKRMIKTVQENALAAENKNFGCAFIIFRTGSDALKCKDDQ